METHARLKHGVRAQEMESKYGKAMDEMEARCELLNGGESREECCAQPGKDCSESVSVEQRTNALPYLEIGLGMLAIGVLATIAYAGAKRNWPGRIWKGFGEFSKAALCGWAVWVGIVVSYLLLRQPYGPRMYEEDYENLALWLTLPPLCAIAACLWVRRFVRKKL